MKYNLFKKIVLGSEVFSGSWGLNFNLNKINNGNTSEAILNTPFNNYRMFDIGMSYQSTVNSNTKDKVEEFSNKKIQELLRKYILQY